MAQAAKSQEPSMEEILASIRRIIAEDDPDKLAQRPSAPAGPAPSAQPFGASSDNPPQAETSRGAPITAAPQHDSRLPSGGNSGAAARASRSPAILDLTESMASPAARPAEPGPVSSPAARASPPAPLAGSDGAADDAETHEPLTGLPRSGAVRSEERGELMSSTTSAAVDSAFSALAQTVLVQNARTLEDLVREMLRPMLKVWLDDNLPGLVERLVRAEIERVSRGRAG
jgi:uncharacterized protein